MTITMRYPLIFVIVLNVAQLVLLEPSCTPQFKCDATNPQKYTVAGAIIYCPANFVCNKDHDPNSCDPCVALSEQTCGFKCLTANSGELSTTPNTLAIRPFECTTGQECNMNYKESCAPCIDIVCRKDWTCNPNNPFEINLGGLVFQCKDGKVCNKNYKYPCDGCILDKTTGPVTTTTKGPPLQYPPNCNDGHGSLYPCRPGPPGSNYYYKCRRVGGYYDFDVKMCSNLPIDSCRKYSYICK